MICQECDSSNIEIELSEDWEGTIYKITCKNCGHCEQIDKEEVESKLEQEDDR